MQTIDNRTKLAIDIDYDYDYLGSMKRERYMTVLGGYKLDMWNHGHLVHETLPAREPGKDYGADPIGDGTFRMVPSGDIVDFAERNRRLSK